MAAAILQSENLPRFRIIKVGGSLFTMSDLRKRIADWSAQNIQLDNLNCVNVWVAGGGAMVDAVREWQNLHGLDDLEAHRKSIDLLSITASLFHNLFLDWTFVTDIHQLIATKSSSNSNVVFDCSEWAKANRSLKADWETTSDSIALQLAIELNASELHLLKSASPLSSKIEDAIAEHLVDKNFASQFKEFGGLSTKISNLRSALDPTRMELS